MQRQVEVRDGAFDNIADFIDLGVELVLPVDEFAAGGFPERGGWSGADESFVGDGVVTAQDVGQSEFDDGFGVVGLGGQRIVRRA